MRKRRTNAPLSTDRQKECERTALIFFSSTGYGNLCIRSGRISGCSFLSEGELPVNAASLDQDIPSSAFSSAWNAASKASNYQSISYVATE
uniref:Uncharacterized protein n=2 Tax=Picea TaxID=3328 RepID=A0A101M4W4_PICGL|nr:hypothetical protein ABT39_MTgene977 [Picea glauca]QHR92879.1 hypothetical protein Q903MT_gene6927 [Picea sitchensis]